MALKRPLKPLACVIEMSRVFLYGVGAFALAIVGLWLSRSSSTETIFESKAKPPQAAPLCPWREIESDLQQFFPYASRYEVETRVLSGLRGELAERLGRNPTGDENALHVYRIYQDTLVVGAVLTRRVKGVYGAIELVLAVDTGDRVRGLRLQRCREPETAASALQNPDWLRSFEGKRADSVWKIGGDLPEVPAEARLSAEAIVEGVRSLLILLVTSQTNVHSATSPHH